MPKVQAKIDIRAPLESCFKLCLSGALLRDSMAAQGVGELVLASSSQEKLLKAGESFEIKGKAAGGIEIYLYAKVESITPSQQIVLTGRQTGQESFRLEYGFSEIGRGTRVTIEMEFRNPKTILGLVLSVIAPLLQTTSSMIWLRFLKKTAEDENYLRYLDQPKQEIVRGTSNSARGFRPQSSSRAEVTQSEKNFQLAPDEGVSPLVGLGLLGLVVAVVFWLLP